VAALQEYGVCAGMWLLFARVSLQTIILLATTTTSSLHGEYAKQNETRVLFRFILFCGHSNLESIHVHAIQG